jgi:serine/threonine protein kinase
LRPRRNIIFELVCTVGRSVRGLLIDFIVDAQTIMAAPERLVHKPSLVDDVLAVLDDIHRAGVLHRDPVPRNILLDKHDRVWWIDFGCAYSNPDCVFGDFEPRLFELEQWATRSLLLDDVVPSAREGRIPVWMMIGA